MLTPIYSFTFLLLVFALSEIIAEKSKALISTTLGIAIILLLAFWAGLSKEVFDVSTINSVGILLVGLLITSLGTMMDFTELKAQWKTVIISLFGCLFAVGTILLCAPLFLDTSLSYVGGSIFTGANTAALILTQVLNEKGLPELSTFCVLLLVTHSFVGIPISSVLLRREAKQFLQAQGNLRQYRPVSQSQTEKVVRRKWLQLPAGYNKPSMMLLKLAIVACISFFVSQVLLKGTVHYFIVALLMGVLFSELGFLEKNMLTLTDSSGFIIFTTTIVIFGSLHAATPALLLKLFVPLMVILALGTLGVCLGGFIIGKLLKVSPNLAIPMGLTCTYGFPTTMLMAKEVANAIGQTPEEKTALTQHLLPKMITAGFITVTIASVLIAGFVVKLL